MTDAEWEEYLRREERQERAEADADLVWWILGREDFYQGKD